MGIEILSISRRKVGIPRSSAQIPAHFCRKRAILTPIWAGWLRRGRTCRTRSDSKSWPSSMGRSAREKPRAPAGTRGSGHATRGRLLQHFACLHGLQGGPEVITAFLKQSDVFLDRLAVQTLSLGNRL